ncbi:hypothetical protein B0T19DRAFT_389380 [Cercophora scortea]|uniref:ubiquitinyl hydrolase 1 n=1 Tax=Cercophora scortea TaxID=314031 RepID=A0AAE0I2X4_9PEZI|nr:hypothetical protein B0T19DRAFT_389380 [Cercophora scortea]
MAANAPHESPPWTNSLSYLIHHVFMPPQLPQDDDISIDHETALTKSLLDSLQEFNNLEATPHSGVAAACRMLCRFLEIRPGIDDPDKRGKLRKVLSDLPDDEHALLHFRAQNSGILVTARPNDLLFEAFELLATNSAVMSCNGRLIREFPDRAALVRRSSLTEPTVIEEFVDVICKLERQTAPVACPWTKKANNMVYEERDTINPMLVTGMVMDVLSGIGRSTQPIRFTKKSKEQVGWNSTRLPFHRSSTWLLLRVALRIVLDRMSNGDQSPYKAAITFHHTCILERAKRLPIHLELKSDLLFSMGAKIARRIIKLDPREEPPWIAEVRKTVTGNRDMLQLRWEKTQEDDVPKLHLGHLSSLSFESDAGLHLHSLNGHLEWINTRTAIPRSTGPGDRSLFSRFPTTTLPQLRAALHQEGGMPDIVLQDFEKWIERHLDPWTASNLKLATADAKVLEQDVTSLQLLIEEYHQAAKLAYSCNPEGLSLMYLTITDLWIAMDKLAGHMIPLILQYNPDFIPGFLDPLILPTKSQMAWLQKIEKYLHDRRSKAQNGYPSAFSAFGTTSSFAVQYFDRSVEHQVLRRTITDSAAKKKTEKLQEFAAMREQHNKLVNELATTDHDQIWAASAHGWYCTNGCRRCSLEARISGMIITTFEWPLPKDENEAKAVVFELKVPQAVSIWRRATIHAHRSVFRTERQAGSDSKIYYASMHSGLSPFFSAASNLHPGSFDKPIERTHYNSSHIGMATPNSVCVTHACHYQYFDQDDNLEAEHISAGITVPPHCSYADVAELPSPLQQWVRTFKHTSNEVIAAQSDCPTDMSLEEFRAFGNIRAGVRLQWANILCQLAVPSLDLNKRSTFFLVLQACFEAGPCVRDLSSVFRDAHIDTQSHTFSTNIMAALSDALRRVGKSNWQNDISLALLARIATRLLSLIAPANSRPVLDYLQRIRTLSTAWARDLLQKLADSRSTRDRREFSGRLLIVALICLVTFDIGPDFLHSVLGSSEELAIFVEASVLARDHSPAFDYVDRAVSTLLLYRWHRVLYESEETVKKEVLCNMNKGIDTAIGRFWAGYIPSSSRWCARDNQQRHILESTVGESGLNVTFNILTGLLMVDGRPLSKLPQEFRTHATFIQLFGQQLLDVMPSTMKGMEYSACRDQEGWVTHFSMIDGNLVIKAVRRTAPTVQGTAQAVSDESSNPEIWEFIPRESLHGDLSASFLNNFSHWINLSTGIIEFRPVCRPWMTSTTDAWNLITQGGRAELTRGDRAVIDLNAQTARLIYNILEPIDSRTNIDLIFHRQSGVLVLDLPRFGISFTLAQGTSEIRSRSYTGMQIDDDQGIGALVGLKSKLVLRSSDDLELASPTRLVLVPRGDIISSLARNHVINTIYLNPSGTRVGHVALRVDSMLGRITDNGSLSARLFLCQLHAVTSHPLPDPLTDRSGTEEALRILGSAAVKSFQRLDDDSYKLLGQIAAISPARNFYPPGLKNMEEIIWSSKLPVLSQNDGFMPKCQAIIDHAKDCELFYRCSPQDSQPDFKDVSKRSSISLVERARIRNSIFCVSEYGAEDYTMAHDMVYSCRYKQGHKNSHRLTQMTRCVDSGNGLLVSTPSSSMISKILEITGTRFGGAPPIKLEFDLDNFRDPSKVLAGLWCGLHLALSETRSSKPTKARTIFFLSSLLYAENAKFDVVQALMALATMEFSNTIRPPPGSSFDLDVNLSTLLGITTKIVERNAKPFDKCPEFPQAREMQGDRGLYNRRYQAWQTEKDAMIDDFVSELQAQWSAARLTTAPQNRNYDAYIDVEKSMEHYQQKLALARRSEQFSLYLDQLAQEMRSAGTLTSQTTEVESEGEAENAEPTTISPILNEGSRRGFIDADSIFSRKAPSTDLPNPERFLDLILDVREASEDQAGLNSLLEELSHLPNLQPHQLSYIEELRSSSKSPAIPRKRVNEAPYIQSLLRKHQTQCRGAVHAIRHAIDEALKWQSVGESVSDGAGLFPRISPVFLLRRLTKDLWETVSRDWRECLLNYALSLAYLQRADRLLAVSVDQTQRSDFVKELLNSGNHHYYPRYHPRFNPKEFAENLVFEVEQSLLVRPVQQRISAMMSHPPEGQSCVMQLNMGEGKSSVIVPIVAAALADGERLLRIVVAKPQAKQMAHLLVNKLGGFLNRRVFYLPFSRSIRLTANDVRIVTRMIETCKREGGVFLVQPEHLLSFKLMGIERIQSDCGVSQTLGTAILKTYQEFELASKDIVDESDENFSAKFELIYTMGVQKAVEMSPDRWCMVQELLQMVKDVVHRIKHKPQADTAIKEGLLYKDQGPGRFPIIRVLSEAAGMPLVEELAKAVCQSGLVGFPIHHQPIRMRQAVLRYITDKDVALDDIAMAEDADEGFFSEHDTRLALLLLRGLLANGVVLFALSQKRFRVNYGLALDRRPPTCLAVPYRAKDSPAPRSEFSHPDVVILLTCLSYYYRGLCNKELLTCLELLSKSDQAVQEYGRWVAESPDMPESFQHWTSINLKDPSQARVHVFPALRYAKPTIDFYLSNVVFPKEMKEFPFKLSASGWDLAKPKLYPLTGFSGTNDSKYVLPLTVRSLDLEEQRHTNAAVLKCLLREENTVLELGARTSSQLSALTMDMLLDAVTGSSGGQDKMRVILDVGAQIIEHSNIQVARLWLNSSADADADVDAVIFFNDLDELSVLTRNGMVDSFLTSPFANQTDRCLVFLDQAHTRGTDLKLPDSYRAAVTLGPGITKDTLVQACMRMRKLGNGQSVTFCVSTEMQKRIRNLRHLPRSQPIVVADILAWAISETWDDALRSVPLWAQQGIRHQYQETIWDRTDRAGAFTVQDVEDYLEPEAQTLEQRYRPRSSVDRQAISGGLMSRFDHGPELDSRKEQMALIKKKCQEFCLSNIDSFNLQEEQERELSPEVEQEREIQRPAKIKARRHMLHGDVKYFVETGVVRANSAAFKSAFEALKYFSASKLLPGHHFPSDLLVTNDFARTVEEVHGAGWFSDEYQRPVQWIMTSRNSTGCKPRHGMHMVIISQWEANEIKPLLESSPSTSSTNRAVLHSYLPRSNLTFRSLEDLNFYTVPSVAEDWSVPRALVMQLNLFAGQLYLRSYKEYVQLCRYLGVAHTENRSNEKIASDGFVGKRRGYHDCVFDSSPIAFLKVMLKKIRRDCVSIEKTHLGRILAGEVLSEKDFA